MVALNQIWTSALRGLVHFPRGIKRMGSFTYTPSAVSSEDQDDDIQFPAKIGSEELLELCKQYLDDSPALLKRKFLPLTGQKYYDCKNDEGILPVRVMQWNILSQALGKGLDNFIKCPPEALDWKRRRFQILKEILQYGGDLICLQEVDHYKFLNDALSTQGYTGVFSPKPDSPCIYVDGNTGPDGCAIFYRNKRFHLVKQNTCILSAWKVESNQVAIMLLLKEKSTGLKVCVATTHLKARNTAIMAALRKEQGRNLLQRVNEFAEDAPILMTGDFNADPTEPVYKMMVNQRNGLSSAYNTGQEPPYTTWKIRETGEVAHTIDYIFYSTRSLLPTTILKFPTAEEIGEGRLPSMTYPSDHISLICDFWFIER